MLCIKLNDGRQSVRTKKGGKKQYLYHFSCSSIGDISLHLHNTIYWSHRLQIDSDSTDHLSLIVLQ